MTKTKANPIGFMAGLGVAASVFLGTYFTAAPATAMAACPAYPSAPEEICPFSGMCGYYCNAGNCELRTACNLPPFTGTEGIKNGHVSCQDNGASCTMTTPCTVGCVT